MGRFARPDNLWHRAMLWVLQMHNKEEKMVKRRISNQELLFFFCSAKNEEEKGLWRCSSYGPKKRACSKCLQDRANQVRRSSRKQPLEIKVEDFIELGAAYFWFLDLIDPFSGMFFFFIKHNLIWYLHRIPFWNTSGKWRGWPNKWKDFSRHIWGLEIWRSILFQP